MTKMTKRAEEVRKNRKQMIEQDILREAEDIFNWILDLIDSDTNAKNFRNVKLYLFDDQFSLKTEDLDGTEYNLKDFLLIYDKTKLFEVLKEIIEKEEGFTAEITNTIVWSSPCILFKVVIS